MCSIADIFHSILPIPLVFVFPALLLLLDVLIANLHSSAVISLSFWLFYISDELLSKLVSHFPPKQANLPISPTLLLSILKLTFP